MSFIVFRSSAGSGKTYTLVREYLRLILQEPNRFRNILAITFTNKAAQEMKDRLLLYLARLSIREENPPKDIASMVEWLAIHCQIPKDQLPARAARALSLILHQYNALSVGTIDGFMHQVVRSFAHDMGIPSGFEVELDEAFLCELAVDNLLDRAGRDQELTQFLVSYIYNRVSDDVVPRLEKDLLSFAEILLKEDARLMSPHFERFNITFFQQLSENLRKRRKAFEAEVRNLAASALAKITAQGYSADDFYQKGRGIYSWFLKLSKGVYSESPNSHTRKTLEEGRWSSGKQDTDPAFTSLTKDLHTLAQAILDVYETRGRLYFDDILVDRTLHRLALLGEIWKELKWIRDTQGKMPISDFNSLVNSKVMGESVPYIYERLGQRYHHFMIDEFQDTSVLQWRNLLPLVENGLSEGFDTIIVGDGKQSIYRWRNGEVEQFAVLPKVFRKGDDPGLIFRERILEAHYREERLDFNYRSSHHIVAFNNEFFTKASEVLLPEHQPIYAHIRQQVAHPGKAGRIEVQFMDSSLPKAEQCEMELKQLLEIVEKEQRIAGALKGVAVLCRSNNDARLVSRFLLQHDINVVSAEAIQIGTAVTVRAVMACMSYLFDPEANINRVSLLEALHAAGLLKGDWHIIMQAAGFYEKEEEKRFPLILQQAGIIFKENEWLKLPLVDLIEELLRLLGMHELSDVHLQFMLDTVESYARKEGNDLCGFLSWWDEYGSKKSAVIPEGLDAVRVMTIHKAKGLQFPVVICPFIREKYKGKGSGFWVELNPEQYDGLPASYIQLQKKLAPNSSWLSNLEMEDARLLMDHHNTYYVAFTRPKERLYILCPGTKPSDSKDKNPDTAKSIVSLLQHFVKTGDLFVQDQDKWVYGDYPTKNDSILEPDGKSKEWQPPFTLFSAPWRDRLSIRSQATENWIQGNDEQSVSWGEWVHALLANLRSLDDLAPALERMGMDTASRPDLIRDIHELLQHPLIEPFFSSKARIRAEASILMPDGHTLRPDRVLFTEDETRVVDFKTGKANPSHQDQVQTYMKVLRQMGYPRVSGMIAYIGTPPRVVPLH